MKSVRVVITIDVPFHSYGTKKEDAKAKTAITRQIRDDAEYHFNIIDIHRNENGKHFNDCSRGTKVKVIKIKE